jgi:uncharacterized protein (DUF2235 family)
MSDSHSPKRIVLLSDGTGNSSAKLMKTNVWRMYEAVDLSQGDQVACYDNGVGTSSFKPLALLGGAIGWGLKRNVRNLYTFACRHYAANGGGPAADEIYAFGFSRGAFTIRVLIGLIESQGLIVGQTGGELDRLAAWAYREYRRQFNPTGGLVRPLRRLRNLLLRYWDRLRKHPDYSQAVRVKPAVRFVGLWDTVDAYGLPIDEMTRGWDEWVWPLSMCERTRPDNVAKICHAISLDDERHTFHPVLLNERNVDLVNPAQKTPISTTDEERVTQVWFAGVHSNVGGGYPDDALAYVSLLWMADEATKCGLRLHSVMTDVWKARADPNGPASDSRRGLGAYYRYNPRRLKPLVDEVAILRPKIHHSVFQRIVSRRDEYAPIVLPEVYDVVEKNGTVVPGDARHERPAQAAKRCVDQEAIWNRVWLRRGLYFTTVGVTLALVLSPYLLKERVLGDVDRRAGSITDAVHLVGAFLPGFLQPIATYWESHPVIFAALAVALVALLSSSTVIQHSIADRMRALWDRILCEGPKDVPKPVPPSDLAYRIRTSPLYQATIDLFTEHVYPFVFGVASLIAVLLIVGGTANRALFALSSALGAACPGVSDTAGAIDPTHISFDSSKLCQSTGVLMERGKTYEVSIALPPNWADAGIPATLAGFGSSANPWVFVPALPFRRVLRNAWFVPVARIGRRSPELHALTKPVIEITPRRTGHLYLFVNDAIGIPPVQDYFYRNNKGGPATVSVKERTGSS